VTVMVPSVAARAEWTRRRQLSRATTVVRWKRGGLGI
jgi:hypothetical protein